MLALISTAFDFLRSHFVWAPPYSLHFVCECRLSSFILAHLPFFSEQFYVFRVKWYKIKSLSLSSYICSRQDEGVRCRELSQPTSTELRLSHTNLYGLTCYITCCQLLLSSYFPDSRLTEVYILRVAMPSNTERMNRFRSWQKLSSGGGVAWKTERGGDGRWRDGKEKSCARINNSFDCDYVLCVNSPLTVHIFTLGKREHKHTKGGENS